MYSLLKILNYPLAVGIMVALSCSLFVLGVTHMDGLKAKAKAKAKPPMCRVVPPPEVVVPEQVVPKPSPVKKVGTKSSSKKETHQTFMFANYIMQHNDKVVPGLANRIAKDIQSVGKEFDMSPLYLLALVQVESSFDHKAVSHADCIGLMQVNPKVWVKNKDNKDNLKAAGILKTTKGLYNTKTNLRAGAHIFNVYYNQALKRRLKNPLRYTVSKYYGKGKNTHYTKFKSALANYHDFKQAAL